jgi:hypothetical protein
MKRALQYATAAALATLLVGAATAADSPAKATKPQAKKMRTIPANHTVVVRDAETGDMRAANAEELAELGLIAAPAPEAAARIAPMAARMATPAAAEAASDEMYVQDYGPKGVSVRVGDEFMSQLYAHVDAEGKVSITHAKHIDQLRRERETAKAKAQKSEVK